MSADWKVIDRLNLTERAAPILKKDDNLPTLFVDTPVFCFYIATVRPPAGRCCGHRPVETPVHGQGGFMTRVYRFVLAACLTAGLIAFPTADGMARTAVTNTSCSKCHSDVKTMLPPKHVDVKGEAIVYCLPCHKTKADKTPNPFSARLHRAHAAVTDCALCHTISPGKSFTLNGEKKSLGAFTTSQFKRIRKDTESWAASSYLDNLHARKNFMCSSCHGKGLIPSDTEAGINSRCVACHGTADKLAAKNKIGRASCRERV